MVVMVVAVVGGSRFPIGDGPQRRPLRVLQDAETAYRWDVGRWVQHLTALLFGLTGGVHNIHRGRCVNVARFYDDAVAGLVLSVFRFAILRLERTKAFFRSRK